MTRRLEQTETRRSQVLKVRQASEGIIGDEREGVGVQEPRRGRGGRGGERESEGENLNNQHKHLLIENCC